jgi:hypothetical protein
MNPTIELHAWVDADRHQRFSFVVAFLQWAYEASFLPVDAVIAASDFGA